MSSTTDISTSDSLYDYLNHLNEKQCLICHIKDQFNEFNRGAILTKSPRDVIDIIKTPNEEYSAYEYLTGESTFMGDNYKPRKVKFFMDIENIPRDSNEDDIILYRIISHFISFISNFKIDNKYGLETEKMVTRINDSSDLDKNFVISQDPQQVNITLIAITKNLNSANHKGDSYHVVFNGVNVEYKSLRHWMYAFICLYPQYKKYVDLNVYKSRRLFKLPNQYGVNKEGIHVRPSNNIHKPYQILEKILRFERDLDYNWSREKIKDLYRDSLYHQSKTYSLDDFMDFRFKLNYRIRSVQENSDRLLDLFIIQSIVNSNITIQDYPFSPIHPSNLQGFSQSFSQGLTKEQNKSLKKQGLTKEQNKALKKQTDDEQKPTIGDQIKEKIIEYKCNNDPNYKDQFMKELSDYYEEHQTHEGFKNLSTELIYKVVCQ